MDPCKKLSSFSVRAMEATLIQLCASLWILKASQTSLFIWSHPLPGTRVASNAGSQPGHRLQWSQHLMPHVFWASSADRWRGGFVRLSIFINTYIFFYFMILLTSFSQKKGVELRIRVVRFKKNGVVASQHPFFHFCYTIFAQKGCRKV